MSEQIDTLALLAAGKIMAMPESDQYLGGSTQKKAQIQCIIIDAMKQLSTPIDSEPAYRIERIPVCVDGYPEATQLRLHVGVQSFNINDWMENYEQADFMEKALVIALSNLQPTPPTTKLTDDAILHSLKVSLAAHTDYEPLKFAVSELVQALLSHKSESEAVAKCICNDCDASLQGISRGGNDNSVVAVSVFHDGKISRFTSPQPSDEKLRLPLPISEYTSVLKMLTANGEIRDYDDEIANRIDELREHLESIGCK